MLVYFFIFFYFCGSLMINYIRPVLFKAMRFELATRSVTSPDSENVALLELQDSLT